MGKATSLRQDQAITQEEEVKWRVREVGDALVVGSPSGAKPSSGSSSASSSRRAPSRSLSPVPALRRARLFVSCLRVSDVRSAAERWRSFQRTLERTNGDFARGNRGRLGDPQVVESALVLPLVRDFIEHIDAERSKKVGHRSDVVTGLRQLQQNSGVNERTIRGYLKDEREFMSFSHADKLLVALGKQDLLSSGEIPVKKNPAWTWAEYRTWQESESVRH